MNDLISRQKAIDALCKEGCRSGYCGISCDDVKTIEQLPSAQPEQRWIPCSERLPEKIGHYLVTIENYSKKRFVSITLKDLRGWVSCENITAWQPLPEPYEESGADMRPST